MILSEDAAVNELLTPLSEWLEDDDVTEIAINEPNTVWIEKNSQWNQYDCTLSFDNLLSLANAVAAFTSNNISITSPILSAVLPNGERAQFVIPPACSANTVSVTIRKPSQISRTLDDYQNDGYFDQIQKGQGGLAVKDQKLQALLQSNNIHDFLSQAVLFEKNIVIAGGTGSGKTTFMKALMEVIPTSQRLITIEDVPELFLPNHANSVHLFYPSEAVASDPVTSAKLLKSCLRMKPDRILLAELRGGETFDFINVNASGHGGSITSCHAESAELAFERLAMMAMENPKGQALPYDVLKKLLHQTIDIVIHVTNDVHSSEQLGRHITEIWFKPSVS